MSRSLFDCTCLEDKQPCKQQTQREGGWGMAVESLRMDLSSLILLRLIMMARAPVGDVIRDLRIDWDIILVGRLGGVEVGVSRVLTSKAKQNCRPS